MTTAAPANFDGTGAEVFRNVPLVAHPRSSAAPVSALSVSGTLHRSGSLRLEFQLTAELCALRLAPSVCRPQRRDELWRHTCFELFARRDNQPEYCEFNFSPAGDWAAYEFESYRSTPHQARQSPIEVTLHTSALAQIRLSARIDLHSAFAKQPLAADLVEWRLNCAAVIESTDGSLSYWAVHHPRPEPDFHDAAGFCILVNGSRAVAGSRGAKR